MPVFRIRSVRAALVAVFAAFVFLGSSTPALAQPDTESADPDSSRLTPDASRLTTFDIPAQPLSEALSEFARQSGEQLLYTPEVTAGRTSSAVQGELEPRDALDLLLEGTEQAFAYTPSGAVLIGDPATIQARAARMDGAQVRPPGGQETTIGQHQPGIEEIIVTGQKREERIQDVPIAISAFSPEDLEAQKIEGGFDLLKGVPNVSFTKTNFTGYNFQIRGIGTQAVSATTDPGVAVSFNNTTLIVNRLFEQEYLDVERVEVLRGPQGTLFGRNATGGVINVISNKPELGVWDGMIDVEVGNYNTRRLRGFFNAPIGNELAIRGAYASTQRDGFGINEAAEDPLADVSRDVDDRDLWTGRLSLGWQPSERLRFNLIWERFEEDDQRVRTSKQICHRDPTPSTLGGDPAFDREPVNLNTSIDNPFTRAKLSQGCREGSLYTDAAFGTPNGASLPFVGGFWDAVTAVTGETTARELPLNSTVFALGGNPFSESGVGTNPDAADCEDEKNFIFMHPVDICRPDPYIDPETGEPRTQSRDLRTIHSQLRPQYRAEADIVELSFDWEWTENLVFSSQTVYADDQYFATQDFNRFTTAPIWNDSAAACDIQLIRQGFTFVSLPNCDPDEGGGVGNYAPLTDENGDGIIDQTGVPVGGDDPLRQESGTYTVDGDGFVVDESGGRVGFYRDLSPGGVLCDPQLGCSKSLVAQDLARSTSTQYSQELRLVSSYPGDWNFSLGANYTKFRTRVDYFVFANALTHLLNFGPLQSHASWCVAGKEDLSGEIVVPPGRNCRYVDPNPLEDINGEGHNYFRSANPYKLTSSALFGELYWNATETVKVTAGLRMSWDQKTFTPFPSQLLLGDARELQEDLRGVVDASPEDCFRNLGFLRGLCNLQGNAPGGRGSPADPDIIQSWREPTGRLVVDWQPVLGFTDETMVYASFSRGYKGGGANPPSVAVPARFGFEGASEAEAPATFEPEFVNAYELGTKNTLFGGAVVLNGSAFYYDYTDYQISKIVNRQAINENFDADIWGLELETIFAPSLAWQFNAAIGFLQTEIADGEQSIDLMDRAQGGNRQFTPDPDAIATDGGTTDFPDGFDRWTVIKPASTVASNCVVPTELLEAHIRDLADSNAPVNPSKFCPAGSITGAGFKDDRFLTGGNVPYFNEDGNLVGFQASDRHYDPAVDAPNGGAGFFADLSGNEMPNSPEFTVALGGQYNFDLTRDWRATARVDYYWQDSSFARVYNTEIDRLKSWSNTNLSFWVTNPTSGITVEGYVKNVFDETPITGTFLNSDDTGLTTNVFTLDPRLIGVSVRKEF